MTNVHPDPVTDDDIDTDETSATSRRAALKALAFGGAGAAVGAVAFGGGKVSAADEDPLLLGTTAVTTPNNISTTPTVLDYDGPAITEGPSILSAGEEVPAADAPFPAAVGGYGGADVANGVHGSTTNAAGHGVVAASLAAKAATATDPAPAAALGVASANGSHIVFLVPEGVTPVSGPTDGVHVPGELYVDADGSMWFSVRGGPTATGASWIKLAGPDTAGAYHAIDPARSYDSRKTGYAAGTGPLAPNQNREISVADAHQRDTSTVTITNVVPAGATAVMVNVTVSSPTDKNFIAVTAGNVTTTATSLQNWDAGVTQIANSVVVPLSPTRTIRVYMGDQAGSADVIVDVFGYYM